MRRALVTAILLASATVAADEPAAVEDPMQAMRDRGIVRKASKKHYVIIVPPAPENRKAAKGVVLADSTIYFGELGKLRVVPGVSWSLTPLENRVLGDPRDQYAAEIERNADYYTVVCTPLFDPDQTERRIELTSVDDEAAQDALAKAKIVPAYEPYRPFLLARTSTTNYVYIDRSGTRGTNYRLFLGKRGAMKHVKIKEIADDSDALSLVTAKGTLTYAWSTKGATWGSAKKPVGVKPLDVGFNRKLIRDLGMYTKEPSGHPCHEL